MARTPEPTNAADQPSRRALLGMTAALGVASVAGAAPAVAAAEDPHPVDADAELFCAGHEILRHMEMWNTESHEHLTFDQTAERERELEERFADLRECWDPLWPTTLAGLAMVMRVEFGSWAGAPWAAAAMQRPLGPTEEELEDERLDGEHHMLWLYIDHLERIAGLRERPTQGGRR